MQSCCTKQKQQNLEKNKKIGWLTAVQTQDIVCFLDRIIIELFPHTPPSSPPDKQNFNQFQPKLHYQSIMSIFWKIEN